MAIEFRESNLFEGGRLGTIRRTIRQAIGERPGKWIVDVHENQSRRRITIAVIGLFAFGIWRKSFGGGSGITLRAIEKAVSDAVKDRLAD